MTFEQTKVQIIIHIATYDLYYVNGMSMHKNKSLLISSVIILSQYTKGSRWGVERVN